MKIVRYKPDNSSKARAGVLRDDKIYDVANGGSPWGVPKTLNTVTSDSEDGVLESIEGKGKSKKSVKILPPVGRGRRLFCLGGVYTGHLEESGLSLMVDPNQWVIPENAIIGQDDQVVLPDKVKDKVMPAAELCVVVGKQGKYIDPIESIEHIAGYTISNDVTARTDWPGPMGYKMMDTFSPVGPFVKTSDEVNNPHNLDMKIRQGGGTICEGNTSGMRFTLSFLLSYISTITKLHPGDVISTGDPGGVTQSLQPGETVEIEIEDIGTLRNEVVTE